MFNNSQVPKKSKKKHKTDRNFSFDIDGLNNKLNNEYRDVGEEIHLITDNSESSINPQKYKRKHESGNIYYKLDNVDDIILESNKIVNTHFDCGAADVICKGDDINLSNASENLQEIRTKSSKKKKKKDKEKYANIPRDTENLVNLIPNELKMKESETNANMDTSETHYLDKFEKKSKKKHKHKEKSKENSSNFDEINACHKTNVLFDNCEMNQNTDNYLYKKKDRENDYDVVSPKKKKKKSNEITIYHPSEECKIISYSNEEQANYNEQNNESINIVFDKSQVLKKYKKKHKKDRFPVDIDELNHKLNNESRDSSEKADLIVCNSESIGHRKKHKRKHKKDNIDKLDSDDVISFDYVPNNNVNIHPDTDIAFGDDNTNLYDISEKEQEKERKSTNKRKEDKCLNVSEGNENSDNMKLDFAERQTDSSFPQNLCPPEDVFTCNSAKNVDNSQIINSSSDDEFMNVRLLDCNEDPVPFEIPPLHVFETVHTFTEKQKEFLQNVPIKKGPFTREEDEIIKRNFKDFVKRYNESDPVYLLGIGSEKKDSERLKFLKAKHFYVRLAKDLNDRTLSHVYKRARIILHPNRNVGKLTVKEIENLKKVRKYVTNKWHQIGDTIGKTPESCKEIYRYHEKDITKGKFTEEEKDQLIEALKKVSGRDDISCGSIKGISWEKVASYIPTKNSFQCRLYWANNLAWKPGSAKKKWNYECYCKLVQILKELNVENSSMVDWYKVYQSFEDFAPSDLYVQKRFFYMKSQIRGNETKSFKEIINILCKKYFSSNERTS